VGLGYQFTDRRSFDYELWYLEGSTIALRGPRAIFDNTLDYWTFLGAAQTFGRFTDNPFPALVSTQFGKAHLNLGFGGAGPEYFLKHSHLLEKINKSSVCFLQMMSGRSTSTSLLKAVGHGGMLKFIHGPLEDKRFIAAEAYQKLLSVYGREAAEQQIAEARESWVAGYTKLIKAITVPIVGVWMSYRGHSYTASFENANVLLGEFPQLITQAELEAIESLGVEIGGRPFNGPKEQLLLDYTTRKPAQVYDQDHFASRADWSRSYNTYYPTPEMHVAIANDIAMYLMANREKYGLDR